MPIDLLLREKPARLLLALRSSDASNTVSSIAKSAGMSFVHASNLISGFAEAGIIETSRSGREKHVKLTGRGAEVAAALEALITAFTKKETPAEPPTKGDAGEAKATETEGAAFPEPPPQEKQE